MTVPIKQMLVGRWSSLTVCFENLSYGLGESEGEGPEYESMSSGCGAGSGSNESSSVNDGCYLGSGGDYE